jgi:hypothetical protein
MQGLAAAFQRGDPIRVVKHAGGWSVQCDSGLLVLDGKHGFAALEPLLETLKSAGIDCLLLEM